MDDAHYRGLMNATVEHLKSKKKALFLTTSNRWEGEHDGEKPKSTLLAYEIAKHVGNTVEVIEIPQLKIYPCEGNVSTARGNICGVLGAQLRDPEKNPTGFHRCWASINNPDDELWKVSKALFASDAVVFFGSVRWGQMNSYYQKLIERLTWIENRKSTLQEKPVIDHIEAGIIAVGQNWNGANVVQTQKDVLSYFGFQMPDELSWNWQFLPEEQSEDESQKSYREATVAFRRIFLQT